MWPIEHWQIQLVEHTGKHLWIGSHKLIAWQNSDDQFLLINERMYFVDLPGYGYAKVPKAVKAEWGSMVERYLRERPQLKLAVILVDSRMPPTESDTVMKQWLDREQIPNTVVLTKTDKISRNQLNQALQQSALTLNTKEIISFSAVTGFGKDELLDKIRTAIDHIPQ